jgi:peptidoglycan L-alanyl-D-glutamate endopeptidase CwlK
MSGPLFPDDILFLQRLLRAEDLYQCKLDGTWGPETDTAVKAFDAQALRISQNAAHTFDSRSEANIATLCLRAQREARAFLPRLLDGGFVARIISGTRTYAEQNALFRKGRFGNAGKIVTNARGGSSNHNFCIAWDIGIFEGGAYVEDGPQYDQAANRGLVSALEWGGSWKTFVDKPHYQLSIELAVSALRNNFETGSPIPGFALDA